MSERDVSLYIVDIFIAIDKIKRYTQTFRNAKDFLHSEMEWDATLRALQLLGDAVNIVLKYNLVEPAYRRIVDFRNQIVHGYFGIDEKIVWEIVTKKLLSFEEDMLNAIATNKISLTDAIESAIKDNCFNKKIIEYLISFKKKVRE